MTVSSEHLPHGARAVISDYVVEDDAFLVEPGRPRSVRLRRRHADAELTGGSPRARNLTGHVAVHVEGGR